MEVALPGIMCRYDQIVIGLPQHRPHVELPAAIPVRCPELYFEQHVVDVEVAAFGEDDDVAPMDHQVLDFCHVAGDLLLVLQHDLVVLLHDQVLADGGRPPAAEDAVAVLPVSDELSLPVVELL